MSDACKKVTTSAGAQKAEAVEGESICLDGTVRAEGRGLQQIALHSALTHLQDEGRAKTN